MVKTTDLFSWLVSVFGLDDPVAGMGLGFSVAVGGVANGVRSGENGFSPKWKKKVAQHYILQTNQPSVSLTIVVVEN